MVVRGWSWSLKRDVAAKFPFYGRYQTEVPLLLTARIPKSRAAALKLARQEQEIIVFDYPDNTFALLDGRILGRTRAPSSHRSALSHVDGLQRLLIKRIV